MHLFHIHLAISWCVESGKEMCYLQCINSYGMTLSLLLLHTSYIGVQGRITEMVKWILFLLKMSENMIVLYTEYIDCIVCLIMLSHFCICKYLYK